MSPELQLNAHACQADSQQLSQHLLSQEQLNQRLQQQRGFMDEVMSPQESEPPGMNVYRNNLIMTAERALSLSYPVLKKMLGPEAMTILARQLLQQETPHQGDWAEWGSSLDWLIVSSELHEEHPYLADMASFEWRIHSLLRSPLNGFAADSLRLLAAHPLQQLGVRFVPSLSVFVSEYPVAQLRQLHRPLQEHYLPAESAVFDVFSERAEHEYSLLWLNAAGLQIQSLSEAEYDWFQHLLQGQSLDEVIDATPQVDFARWLSNAIQCGWLTEFYLR
ncbi:MAG: hypothetical protein CMI08_12475 [Oceanospirillaceae bacterium]|uniref:HvfC/BufC N-terminal domain-containing protein n=1 Tax=unclassified Thalassolituus TaxID=2624967 RepID=UPI000C3A698D|nr:MULTISPECIES: DNA-binding domain-containing protein [unclassified Thalassolituus]MAS26619.1 hypothetical protein [Oceanospirillaceae bacterium]MAX99991.1 hypothetical protein [Oceanospirillaceae bacterium]MBL35228.1 hypothetical protein [Oceanospirillaceae bacterium]MBS51564.1 hypothetical protein [Oceanospirillaceae bacterium]|tara:strand:- start:2843 stop:3673 length:831 start_codon:yes stop_codon:yes gene_type:complete